ncbi:MAG: hypothetical protein KC635_19875, partial [Myxococcales bacterium]|nr:hypothetical protein [Myxococcales bacterium]
PCDASGDGANTVSLVVENLYADGERAVPLDRASWLNPCGDPTEADYDGNPACVQAARCVANSDTPVSYDLTILRSSARGFFDIAVAFDDMFCAAKVDCEGPDGDPLRLVYDPTTHEAVESVVFALACTDGDATSGADDATHLYLDDLVLRCGDATFAIDPSRGPGFLWPDGAGAPDPLVQGVVYTGVDTMPVGDVAADDVYWSVALGLDPTYLAALPDGVGCVLETKATASRGPLAGGRTPDGAIYPFISVSVPLADRRGRLCSRHPLNGDAPNDGVRTSYTRPSADGAPPAPVGFQYEASADVGVVTVRPTGDGRGFDPCAGVVCGENERCVGDARVGHCECAPGFASVEGRGCQDIDACALYPCPEGFTTCQDLPAPALGDVYGRVCGPWRDVPRDAEPISEEELQALAEVGTLVPMSADWRNQAQVADAEMDAADAATLAPLVANDEALRRRIYDTRLDEGSVVLADGNVETLLPVGRDGHRPITLNAGRTRLHEIAEAHRRFNTKENQIRIYAALYPRLSSDCVASRPLPADAADLPLAALKRLNKELARCWRDAIADLGPTPEREPVLPAPADYVGAADPPGDSEYHGDVSGDECLPSTNGYYKSRNWTGKSLETDVKNQGRRGACVAFATVGAMERGVRFSENRWVNLSEQALYAYAKLTLEPGPQKDGLVTSKLLPTLAEVAFKVPFEQIWPYNASPSREDCLIHPELCDPIAHRWVDSCVDRVTQEDYDGPACSDLSHQAKLVTVAGGVYSWVPTTPQNGVYSIFATAQLDDIEDSDSASLVTAVAGLGFGVVMGFDVYPSFKAVASTDLQPSSQYAGLWDGIRWNEEKEGSHAIEVSGVISTGSSYGGGLIVLKNSWSTCFGDGGYAYIAFSAAGDVTTSVTALFPKQTGYNEAPKVAITSPTTASSYSVLAGEQLHFAGSATDTEDGSACCGLKWTLSPGGQVLGNGTSVDVSFATTGTRTVTLTATDSLGKKTSKKVTVAVTNADPEVTIDTPSNGQILYRDVPFIATGHATDPDHLGGVPCSALHWSSTVASDSLNGAVGCEKQVTFTTLGYRVLTLSAADGYGGADSATVIVQVVDVPAGAPPQVTITHPYGTEAAPYSVANPSATLTLSATVYSPGGFFDCPAGAPSCKSYAWQARKVGTAAWTPIGTTKNLVWTPTSTFSFYGCSPTTVEAQLCVTDPNGTTCKSTFLSMYRPPC